MEAVCSSHTCKSCELFGKGSALDGELLVSACIMRRGACDREGEDANKIEFDSVAAVDSPSLRDPMHRARARAISSVRSAAVFRIFLHQQLSADDKSPSAQGLVTHFALASHPDH